jgi:hypothetical protein
MDEMMRKRLGEIAGNLIEEAVSSDLDWEEAIAALGIAAKAIACAAARALSEDAGACEALALQRLHEAFSQDIRLAVVPVCSGSEAEEEGVALSNMRAGGADTKLH